MPVKLTRPQLRDMLTHIFGWKYVAKSGRDGMPTTPPWQTPEGAYEGWPDPTSWLFVGPLLVALDILGFRYQHRHDNSRYMWWMYDDPNYINGAATLPDAILTAGLAVLEAKDEEGGRDSDG